MSNKCDWCEETSDTIVEYEYFGNVHNICNKCKGFIESDICRTCKESLYGGMAIKGECDNCQQIREVKEEKRRTEVLNGLGVDMFSELNSCVTFTEEDYEKWVTFGQGNFTVEYKNRCRREWIKHKLLEENGWDEKTFNENIDDMMYLMEHNVRKMFNRNCTFAIKSVDSKKLRGVNIVDMRNNVVIIDTSNIDTNNIEVE